MTEIAQQLAMMVSHAPPTPLQEASLPVARPVFSPTLPAVQTATGVARLDATIITTMTAVSAAVMALLKPTNSATEIAPKHAATRIAAPPIPSTAPLKPAMPLAAISTLLVVPTTTSAALPDAIASTTIIASPFA